MAWFVFSGSRTLNPTDAEIESAVWLSGFDVTGVIVGGATGVDLAVERWARKKFGDERVVVVHARWRDQSSSSFDRGLGYDPAAGFARNRRMLERPEVVGLIALWDAESGGTADAIATAHELRRKVFVHEMRSQQPILEVRA